MAKITMFVDYKSDKPLPFPKPDYPIEPYILSVLGGIPVPPHTELGFGSHPTEENYVIVEGQARMHSSRVEKDVKKGDFIHLPPWCWHSLKNTGPKTCVALVAAAPPNP